MPPPAQHPAAPRASQLPARQLPFDYTLVTVYREHDASKRQLSGPPQSFVKDHGEGRAFTDLLTMPANSRPCRTRNTSDANPLQHRHPPAPHPPAGPYRPGAAADENTASRLSHHPHRHPQRRYNSPPSEP